MVPAQDQPTQSVTKHSLSPNECCDAVGGSDEVELKRPHVWLQLGGARAVVETPTLALLDTGADIEGLVCADELTRLGIPPEAIVLDKRGEHTVTPLGGGTPLRVLGHIVCTPMVAGVRAGGRGSAALELPPLRLLVIGNALAPYQVLLGARYMRVAGPVVDLHRHVWLTCGDAETRLLVPLVRRVATPQARGEVAECEIANTLAAADHLAGLVSTQEWMAQRRLMALACDALDDDVALGCAVRTEQARWAEARHVLEVQRDRLLEVASDASIVGMVARGIGTNAEVAAAGRQEDATTHVQAAEKLLEELLTTQRQETHERTTTQQLEETKKQHDLVTSWIARLMDTAEGAAFHDGELLGCATAALSETQQRQLVEDLRAVCGQLRDPRVVPRRTEATRLPLTVVLELVADAKPTQDGYKRQFSTEKIEEIHKQLDTLIAGGLVEVCRDPRWVHAVVLAKKPDGRWRFAVDFRPLNAATQDVLQPLPDIDCVLRELASEGRVYSQYDLSDAFFQLELEEAHRDLTAFYVPGRGTYRFRVMAMGLKAATAVFQRNMQVILAPLWGKRGGVIAYVDDVVVYGSDEAQLLSRMRALHALFIKYDLRVSAKKVKLLQRRIEFLGRTVQHGQIAIATKHVSALQQFERPQTVKDMQRFLGMVNYHREFVPKLGDDLAPLLRMEVEALRAGGVAKNGVAKRTSSIMLQWSEAANVAFESLRCKLAEPPVLVVPRMDRLVRRIRLESDAATECNERRGGVGGAVYWMDDSGTWRLVLAHSRVLRDAERKYAPVEVELLAVIELLKAASWILRKATDVLVVTDHQALTYIGKLAQHQHGRLARWSAKLLEYDLRMTYRPGTQNVVPDALSRGSPGQYERHSHSTPVSHTVRDLMRQHGASASQVASISVQHARLEEDPRWDHRIETAVTYLRGAKKGSVEVVLVDFPWLHVSEHLNKQAVELRTEQAWQSLSSALEHALSDDALVFVAAPMRTLTEATRLMATQQCRYHTALVWNFGSGATSASRNWPTTTHELVLVFSRGNYSRRLQRGITGLSATVTAAPHMAGRHPDDVFALIDTMTTPDAHRVHLFARRTHGMWSTDRAEQTPPVVVQREVAVNVYDLERGAVPPVAPPATAREWAAKDKRTLADQSQRECTLMHTSVDPVAGVALALLLQQQAPAGWSDRVQQAATVGQRNEAKRWVRLLGAHVEYETVSVSAVRTFIQTHPDNTLLLRAGDARGDWIDVATMRRVAEADEGAPVVADIMVTPIITLDATHEGETRLVVLPVAAAEYREAVARRLHQSIGHLGVCKMAFEIRKTGWYLPDVTSLLTKVALSCDLCAQRKGHPRVQWLPAQGPDTRVRPATFNDVVHLDFIGPLHLAGGEQRYIVSFTDELTRWPEAEVVTGETAQCAARSLLRMWVSRYGQPLRLVSDRGSAFVSALFGELCALMGVERLRTTAQHPHSNGIEERPHKNIADIIALTMQQLGKEACEWADVLDIALMVMRATVNRHLGCTPAKLVLGQELAISDALLDSDTARRLRNDDVLRWQEVETKLEGDDRATARVRDAQRLHQVVLDLTQQRLRQLSEHGGGAHRPPTKDPLAHLQVGDYVQRWQAHNCAADPLVLNPKLNAHRWSTPWRIVERVRGAALLLARADDPLVTDVVTGAAVRRVTLDPDVKRQYDELFVETMAQKKQELEQRQLVRARMEWAYEPDDARVQLELERIVDVRGAGRSRQVRVHWKDGSETWEPLHIIAVDAPQAWTEYKERNSRARRHAARREDVAAVQHVTAFKN